MAMKFYLISLYNELDPAIVDSEKDGAFTLQAGVNIRAMIIAAKSEKEAVGEAWEKLPHHRIVNIGDATSYIKDELEIYGIEGFEG